MDFYNSNLQQLSGHDWGKILAQLDSTYSYTKILMYIYIQYLQCIINLISYTKKIRDNLKFTIL